MIILLLINLYPTIYCYHHYCCQCEHLSLCPQCFPLDIDCDKYDDTLEYVSSQSNPLQKIQDLYNIPDYIMIIFCLLFQPCLVLFIIYCNR